jgi:hypothetical protein
MLRRLWIGGLSIALLVYGSLFLGVFVRVLRLQWLHHHVHAFTLVWLGLNGYMAWLVFWYLLQKIHRWEAAPEKPDTPLPRL